MFGNPFKGLSISGIIQEAKSQKSRLDAERYHVLEAINKDFDHDCKVLEQKKRKALDKRAEKITGDIELADARIKSLVEQLQAVRSRKSAFQRELDLLDGVEDGKYFEVDVHA